MTVMIPAEFRYAYRWFGNLDAFSAATGLGLPLFGLHGLLEPGPVGARIATLLVTGGVGVVLGFVRWPLDHGDKAWIWIRRGFDYWWRPRRGSAFGA